MAQMTMPKMGDAMEEGTLVEWLKKEGEPVEEQEPIAAIETEKSSIEIVSFYSGRIARLLVEAGQTVPVGTPIAVIDTGQLDADASSGLAAEGAAREVSENGGETNARSQVKEVAPGNSALLPEPRTSTADTARVKASPLAKKIAAERGLDLSQVPGTGPGGRVVEADVEEYLRRRPADLTPRSLVAPGQPAYPAASTPAAPPAAPDVRAPAAPAREERRPAPALPRAAGLEQGPSGEFTERELSGIRKTIARRLVESKREIPHFYVTSAIDMRAAAALRDQVNALRGDQPKISFNDLIVRACALALRRFPTVNAQLLETRVRSYSAAHIGIAVALPEGLIVPVLRDADRKSLSQIADETRALAERARAGQLKPEEYSGGTFTISNLGMYDVESFIGIINPPECALLAVGSIAEVPVVADGRVGVGQQMHVSLSADHRVVDGAVAAQFLQEVKRHLQEPLLLI